MFDTSVTCIHIKSIPNIFVRIKINSPEFLCNISPLYGSKYWAITAEE